MKIRSKLTWTYIILLISGIILISSYSILTIRSFLLKSGIVEFEKDVRSLVLSISSFSNDSTFTKKVSLQTDLSGYEIAIFNDEGMQIAAFPDSGYIALDRMLPPGVLDSLRISGEKPIILNLPKDEHLTAYANLNNPDKSIKYLKVSQLKTQYYMAIADIRHIIYGGMFFSVGAVIIVSYLFARYMSAPIQQLNSAALAIAEGDLDRELNINRNDEFATLAHSLNNMAGTLRADNEKLKRFNEKQSQFFADITHEVRNPLHTISGALEMAEIKNLDPDKKAQYLKLAQKQVLRIGRLFEDIKSLQLYDFDESFLHKKTFDLVKIADEVVGAYQHTAEEKGITLGIEQTGECLVDADPDKIEQVLDNLISNAVKYTNAGHIRVSCTQIEEEVEVSIKDTGIGIGDEHLERLFDRFYRTDKARSRDKGGTGLGLAVVKSILAAHQRTIFVDSKVGKGSCFYFSLPLSKKD